MWGGRIGLVSNRSFGFAWTCGFESSTNLAYRFPECGADGGYGVGRTGKDYRPRGMGPGRSRGREGTSTGTNTCTCTVRTKQADSSI